MVEVFKTSVETRKTADELLQMLHSSFPELRLNFDLEDCDNILRAEGKHINSLEIIKLIEHYDHFCTILD
ncbi:MAG TPA: hypothetical protein VGF30_13320 [Bacteroidia bacterium]